MAVFSIVVNAQRGVPFTPASALHMEGLQVEQPLLKGPVAESPRPAKTEGVADTLVVPPAGLQTTLYQLSAVNYLTQAPESFLMKVGVQGTDVYVQGLCKSYPQAWLQGTLDVAAGQVSLPINQMLKANAQFASGRKNVYFTALDADLQPLEALVVSFDVATGAISFPADVIVAETPGIFNGKSVVTVIYQITAELFQEVAATPATPAIGPLVLGSYGDRLSFNIPPTDVDGNALVTDKLTYHLLKDVGGSEEVVTFTSDEYVKLNEDMTEIPYGFADGYDIATTALYLNMDHGDWDRVGIQSTYTGGGESHQSAIAWLSMPRVVTPPDGLQTEEMVIKGMDSSFKDQTNAVLVGFSGDEVYLKGISKVLPDAWLKGTLSADGATITFAAGQYMGKYGTYDLFLNTIGTTNDLVFSYDQATGKMTSGGMAIVGHDAGFYDVWYYPNILRPADVAAVPANPSIVGVSDRGYGDVMQFEQPLTDVNGQVMMPSKVAYRLYKEVNREASQVTLLPEHYQNLTEPMSEVPYGYFDDYDFYAGQLYLEMPHADWNRIGIQTVYTGGGETNVSEIAWYVLNPYTEDDATWVAADQGYTDKEELTAPITLTEGYTMTISQANGVSPKYYDNGAAVRVYRGNTILFRGANKIKRVVMNVVSQDYLGNMQASAGTLTKDSAAKQLVWEGNAKKFVLSNMEDVNVQLRIVSIDLTYSVVEEPVEVPADMETADYTLTAQVPDNNMAFADDAPRYVKVGYANGNVYIKGVSTYLPDAWIEGELNADGTVATFEPCQYMGSFMAYDQNYNKVTYNGYLTSVDSLMADVPVLQPVVMNIDSETNTITAAGDVIVNSVKDKLLFLEMFRNLVLNKVEDVEATPANPEITKFVGTGYYRYMQCIVPALGTNGENLLPSHLSYQLFVVNGEGNEEPLTFTTDLYTRLSDDMTIVPWDFTDNYDIIVRADGGRDIYLNQPLAEMQTWKKLGLQTNYNGAGVEHKSDKVWYDVESYYVAVGITEMPAANNGQAEYTDLSGRKVSPNAKGILIKREGNQVSKVMR